MERRKLATLVEDADARARAESFVLPSRRTALEACLDRMEQGPVLISGDAGVGKTWLAGRVAATDPASRHWIAIDVHPDMNPVELIRCISHRLGLHVLVGDRLALADVLSEETANVRRWGVIIDEAHLASSVLLDEIRVLSNRLGQPDGFDVILLVGQSSLASRLRERRYAGLATRLAAGIHLQGLDIDEAGVLIDRLAPGRALDSRALDLCHRDAGGNPRRLLTLAGGAPPSAGFAARTRFDIVRRPDDEASTIDTEAGPAIPRPRVMDFAREASQKRVEEPTLTGEAVPEQAADPLSTPFEPFQIRPLFRSERPPLVEDDGMIEVGWDADAANSEESTEPRAEGLSRPLDDAPAEPVDPDAVIRETERLADHYAALQAWMEWSKNQLEREIAREAEFAPIDGPITSDDEGIELPEAEAVTESTFKESNRNDVIEAEGGRIWADGQHEFAPYGQLFTRIRQSRDSDG